MALTTAGKNTALNALSGVFTLSLHTGLPGDTGASNEATGGGYSRKTITLGAAASGLRALTATPLFDVAAGSYSHYAIFAGAVCVDTGTLDSTKVLNEAGQISINSGSISLT